MYNLVIDQSTSGTKVILVSEDIIDRVDKKHTQIYPKPGWVEHDPNEIINNIKYLINLILEKNKVLPSEVNAISITNQRETVIAWNRTTGLPIYNALVWQCNRAQEICNQIKSDNLEKIIRLKTGLNMDTYFSGPKLKWLSGNCVDFNEQISKNNLCIGTIDSWIIWNLTDKKEFKTDISNASRTMLYNINNCSWDDELLEIFNVTKESLPEVCDSDSFYGKYMGIPIIGVIADSQASLLANQCEKNGYAKITLGTGSSIMLNSSFEGKGIHPTLVQTIAWKKENKVNYAIEGVIRSMGDTLEWIKNDLELVEKVDIELGETLDSKGVIFIPSQLGMGTPYWTTKSKASINGLSRSTVRIDVIRAVYASLLFQIRDVIDEINSHSKTKVNFIKVDGGISKNKFLMTKLSELLGIPLSVSDTEELSAIGALKLAKKDLEIKYTTYETAENNELNNQYMEWKQYVQSKINMEENYES